MSQNSSGHIVPWPGRGLEETSPPSKAEMPVRVRLEGVLAALRAVESGEFLNAVPECELARMHYRTTVSLLALAERELMEVCRDIGP